MQFVVIAASLLIAQLAAAQAATYPDKPIRLIVPYPPGGSVDFTAREVAQKLSEAWGQQVVIDNRGGGAGMIGTDAIAKSPPDGYTIGLVTSTFSMTPSLQRP